MRIRTVIIVCAAAGTAVAVLGPASPAVATTSVTTKGGVVTIDVPVDVSAPKGRTFRDAEGKEYDAARWFETQAEAIWNEALSRLPYKSCYRFEINVKAKLRPFNAEARDDRHFVIVHDREGGSVLKPRGHTTAPYEGSLDGVWGDLSPGGVAHEVGHLLGLGDQYTRVGNPPRPKPNPGRDGTLMADADGKIDQTLVDQLGKLLDKAGKLPPCESWTGTFRQRAEVVGTGNPCSWTYQGPVNVVVAPGGSLTGNVSASFTEVMEDPALPCVGVPPGGGQATHPISGKRDRNRFTVTVSGPTGSVQLELSVTGKKAEGSTLVGGYIDTSMTLTCKTCDEKEKVS